MIVKKLLSWGRRETGKRRPEKGGVKDGKGCKVKCIGAWTLLLSADGQNTGSGSPPGQVLGVGEKVVN